VPGSFLGAPFYVFAPSAAKGHSVIFTEIIAMPALLQRVVGASMLSAAVALSGCAAGSLASEGAQSGAKSGALGGAVAGAVGSIFWGGNVVGNMAAGAVVGAASGAAIGGASGQAADKKIEAKRNLSEADAALAARLGPANFEAATQLAKCNHKTAIGKARTAFGTTDDRELQRYALLIEAVSNEEMGDTAAAQKVYPLLARTYPDGSGTVEKAHADTLSAIQKVQQVRQEHGAKPTCG
jgi:hypothetical protein